MDSANIQQRSDEDPNTKTPISTISGSTPVQGRQPGPGMTSRGKGQASKKQTEDDGWGKSCMNLGGIIITAFTVAAIYLYTTIDIADHFHTGYNLYDQVIASRASDDYSSVLCDTYTVSVSSLTSANVYLTKEPAVPRQDIRWIFSLTVHLSTYDDFAHRAFYLLPGSVVEASGCLLPKENTAAGAQLLFLRGEDHFNQWKKDPSCKQCITRRDVIGPDKLCSSQRFVNVSYDVGHDTDNYYVVIARQPSHHITEPYGAELVLTVNKTAYDVSNAESQCFNDASCTLSLPFNTPGDVIVQFNDVAGVDDTFFTTDCHKRLSFALGIFLALPLGLVLGLGLLCCLGALCCCKGRKDGEETALI